MTQSSKINYLPADIFGKMAFSCPALYFFQRSLTPHFKLRQVFHKFSHVIAQKTSPGVLAFRSPLFYLCLCIAELNFAWLVTNYQLKCDSWDKFSTCPSWKKLNWYSSQKVHMSSQSWVVNSFDLSKITEPLFGNTRTLC